MSTSENYGQGQTRRLLDEQGLADIVEERDAALGVSIYRLERITDLQAQVERLTQDKADALGVAATARDVAHEMELERDEANRQLEAMTEQMDASVEVDEALTARVLSAERQLVAVVGTLRKMDAPRSVDLRAHGLSAGDTYAGEAQALLANLPPAGERAEKLAKWAPILEVAERQDIKWKKPMPTDIDFGDNSVYVWALKAQEELGELSAALLGGLIGKDGWGDALEECYQLIAVLLRVAAALREMEGK